MLAAPDGEAAVKLAPDPQREHRSVDVTDMVSLPNMGGRELAASRLSELIAPWSKKVLYISGYPDLAAAAADASTLDGEILRKPFSFKALAMRARSLLDSGKDRATDTFSQ